MSKELPQPKQTDEVDLGHVFKLIGNAFGKLFNFIGSIFNSIFLAFVWLVFFVKKHFIKLVIAGILGLVIGIVLEKANEPVYKSYATIKQNYNTGENLYSSISYYKDLVIQGDIKTLMKTLNIEASEAESILDFNIKAVITENQKLQNYDAYLKTLDSVVASTVNYKNYIDNTKEYTYEFQQIEIKAKARNNFKKVFEKIIENIDSNEYFKREQEKDLAQMQEEETALLEALSKSDSLQNTYKRVLEKVIDKDKGAQTSITIEGSTQIDKTKEFDLYKSDLDLRNQLVENRRRQADKKYVIEVISSKQESGIIDKEKMLLGYSIGAKKYYIIVLVTLTFLALLGIDFLKFLEKFKS